jgi:organic radical activating enzyme
MNETKYYSVKEIFYSVQSEGPQSGRPAVFIRFAGCNLKCFFCDTDHDIVDGDKYISEEDLLNTISTVIESYGLITKGLLFVLTGGEPMMQIRDGSFIRALYLTFPQATVSIETNGTVDFTNSGATLFSRDRWCTFPTVVVSPKEGQRVRLRKSCISAVKLLVDTIYTNVEDSMKKVQAKAHNFAGIPIYIQVMEHEGCVGAPDDYRLVIYKLLNRNPTWRLSVQYHKMIGVK